MITGRLNGLSIAANAGASVATYKLDIGSETLHLNPLLGQGLRFSWQPQYQCRNCEVEVPQVMRGGYCKRCFFALARCDSCFVSPARCHFALGSCREPDWGERVCMQGHFVYLANSSGIKVGLTQKGRQQQRWLAQGATQGLVIAVADTRRDAGMLEAAIAKIISDRTQWRRLVAMPPQQVQLQSLRARVQQQVQLPARCRWLTDEFEQQFTYPVATYSPPVQYLINEKTPSLADNLCGIKGQYLLLTGGAFNVSRHVGSTMAVEVTPPLPTQAGTNHGQLSLL